MLISVDAENCASGIYCSCLRDHTFNAYKNETGDDFFLVREALDTFEVVFTVNEGEMVFESFLRVM